MRPDNNEIESPSLLRSVFYRTARSAKIAHTKFHRTRLGMLVPALLAGSMLAACTYVPFDGPRKDSTFMADPAARLDLGLDDLDPGTGIFLPLADGNDALGARLRLIEQARSSIDFKTFLIKPDIAGSLFGVALFKAAERGVRVRLLVDDVFTPAKDSGLAAFDAHPNIEVRIFNPLSRNSITAVNYMLDFGRVNRRMHNKALIVDGYGAIIGGRNIADEYYQIKTSSEFADFDLFLAGSVVGDLGSAFDMYWADQWAVPVSNLYEGATDDEIRAAIAEFDATAQSEEAKIYQRAVDSTYLSDLREGRIKPDYGTAVAVVDPPEKLRERQGGESQTTARELMGAMQRAKSDVVLITPYFVPEEYGVEFFTELEKKGIRVRVVTNSLAATNHPYVHGGYTPYRRALLDAGVELYEVRADAAQHLGLVPEDSELKLTMHTKAAAIDDNITFIGSMNWDPRSIKLNSEIGVFINSPSFNQRFLGSIEEGLRNYTFRIGIDDEGRLVWDDLSGDQIVRRYDEPGASGFSKFLAGVTAALPVEGQL